MEQEILRYLQQARGLAHSVKEVSKRIDRKRYREEPNWARPHLKALVEQDLIQEDANGCFLIPR